MNLATHGSYTRKEKLLLEVTVAANSLPQEDPSLFYTSVSIEVLCQQAFSEF